MSDATTDVKDGQNSPLAGARTPAMAREVLRELTEESRRANTPLDIERGTGEQSDAVWTLEDNERSQQLAGRLAAAHAEYQQRFAGADALDKAMLDVESTLYRADDSERSARSERVERGPSLERLEIARAVQARNAARDVTPISDSQGWARSIFGPPAYERATSIAAISGTTAGNVAGALPVQEYWSQPGQTSVHLSLIPKVMLGNYAYRQFLQVNRVTSAGALGQGDASTEGTFTYAPYNGSMKRYAAHVPVSEELMRDLPMVDNLIYADLSRDIAEKVSRGVLRGTGQNNQTLGVQSIVAASYDGAVGANGVPQTLDWDVAAGRVGTLTGLTDVEQRGFIDVIADAIARVMDVGEAAPDTITTSFRAWFQYVTAKDSDNRYIFRDPSTSGPMMMHGLPLRPTNEFVSPGANDVDAALVGSWAQYSKLLWWGDTELKMGLNGTDLVQGQETIVGAIHCDAFFGRPRAFCRILFNS